MSTSAKNLSADNIIRKVFDETTDSIKISGSISTTAPVGAATEAKQDSQITVLQQIESNTSDLDLNTDGLEALITDTNSKLEDVKTKLDTIDANTDSLESTATTIAGYVDQIEGAQATAQTSLDSINTSLTNIDTSLNSVETSSTNLDQKIAAALVVEKHDYLAITYVGVTTDIDTVTYKDGGAAGTVVATLTMGYDGNGRLQSVTKS